MRLSLLTEAIGEEVGSAPTTVLLRAKASGSVIRVAAERRRTEGIWVQAALDSGWIFAESDDFSSQLRERYPELATALQDESAQWSGVQLTGTGVLPVLERGWRGRWPRVNRGHLGHYFKVRGVLLRRDEAIWELYWPYSRAFHAWRQLRAQCPSHMVGTPI